MSTHLQILGCSLAHNVSGLFAVAPETLLLNAFGRAIAENHCCKHVPDKLKLKKKYMETKCTLSNEDLINKSFEWVKKLAETGGNAWTLRVPVDFNNDPDILFTQLGDRLKAMRNLLEKYEEWEAMMIADNAMWWPYAEKDAMSGKTYDMMLELQAQRNELLGR